MRRVILYSIFLFVAGGLAAQDISGYWEGKIGITKQDSLTVGLQLDYRADTLYAELDSPDQYFAGQPVTGLQFADSVLSFRVPDFKLSYEVYIIISYNKKGYILNRIISFLRANDRLDGIPSVISILIFFIFSNILVSFIFFELFLISY